MRRIEVSLKDKNLDSTGISVKNDILEDLGIEGIESCTYAENYYFDLPLTDAELEKIAEKVLIDPLIQDYSINRPISGAFDFSIEVKLHSDVTDNIGIVAMEGVQDFLGKKPNGRIMVSRKYYFTGKIGEKQMERIAKELLANEVIEKYEIAVAQ